MRRWLDRVFGTWHYTGRTRPLEVPKANGITYVYTERERCSERLEGHTWWARDTDTYEVRGPGDRVRRYGDNSW